EADGSVAAHQRQLGRRPQPAEMVDDFAALALPVKSHGVDEGFDHRGVAIPPDRLLAIDAEPRWVEQQPGAPSITSLRCWGRKHEQVLVVAFALAETSTQVFPSSPLQGRFASSISDKRPKAAGPVVVGRSVGRCRDW